PFARVRAISVSFPGSPSVGSVSSSRRRRISAIASQIVSASNEPSSSMSAAIASSRSIRSLGILRLPGWRREVENHVGWQKRLRPAPRVVVDDHPVVAVAPHVAEKDAFLGIGAGLDLGERFDLAAEIVERAARRLFRVEVIFATGAGGELEPVGRRAVAL